MSSNHQARSTAAAISVEAAAAAFLTFLDHLPESTAVQPLPGGWTPAQHASHLALTNDVFSGVLEGGGPISACEGISQFSEAQWHLDAPPTGVAAPFILAPPTGVSRAAAAAQLRASVARLRPSIATLDPKLAALCVQLPWAVVSVYQMCEWGGGHTMRHLVQVNRELQLAAIGRAPAAS